MKLALPLFAVGVCGNGEADDVLLLQLSHKSRISQPELHDTLTGITNTQDPQKAEVFVEKLAELVSKGDATIDDSTKAVLEGVKKTLEDTGEAAITNTHTNDVTLLNSIVTTQADACASKFQTGLAEDAEQGASVSNQQGSHQTCRTDLAALEADMTQKCRRFESFQGSLTPPCAVPSSTDGLVDFLSTLKTFATTNLQEAQELDSDCKQATAAFEAKRTSCNTLQVTYEMDFCAWRVESFETCYGYETCHKEVAASLEEAATNVVKNQETRKLEWAAIQKIKCYIDVLVSDEETEKRQEAMATCQALEPDTSQLDISVPELAAPETCDLSPVANFPCTDGFTARYAGMTQIRPCTPCADLQPHLQPLQANTYMQVTTEGAQCPSGYVQVMDQATCQGAATTALKAEGVVNQWSSAGTWSDHVPGCFEGYGSWNGNNGNGNVHFGTNMATSGTRGYRICKKKA